MSSRLRIATRTFRRASVQATAVYKPPHPHPACAPASSFPFPGEYSKLLHCSLPFPSLVDLGAPLPRPLRCHLESLCHPPLPQSSGHPLIPAFQGSASLFPGLMCGRTQPLQSANHSLWQHHIFKMYLRPHVHFLHADKSVPTPLLLFREIFSKFTTAFGGQRNHFFIMAFNILNACIPGNVLIS